MNDGQETDREAGEAAYELYEKWTNGQRKSAQTKEGMCTCTTACIQRHTTRDISLCRIAAGPPFVEEFAGPVATRSGWFDRGRLQGLKEAAESVRAAWARHAGKSFDQKFPSTTHECPKCKGFVESIEAISALSSETG